MSMKYLGTQKGMTLIELLVVVSIIGVLLAALAFQYAGWQVRYRVESQVRQTQSDLLDVKGRAFGSRRVYRVTFTANDYRIEAATNDDGTVFAPAAGWPGPVKLDYPSLWVGMLTVDPQGLISPAGTTIEFSGWAAGNSPDFDCLALSQARIGMGKMTGGVCNVK